MSDNYLKLILWVLFCFGYATGFGQTLQPTPWQRSFSPAPTYELHKSLLQTSLDQTSSRWENRSLSTGIYLRFPLPNGQERDYLVWQSEQMAPALAAKFPGITTYFGQDPVDPRHTVHMTSSRNGIKVLFFDHTGLIYSLEPVNKLLPTYQFVYPSVQEEIARLINVCSAQMHEEDNRFDDKPLGMERRGETKLYRYKLALACTGEYGSYHGNSKEEVLIAMNELMTQVNAIFEREVSIHFDLVDNNEQLIFLDPETDPYDNTSVEDLLESNKVVCNYAIGYPNFDLGHVLATKFGGQAQIGSVCNFSRKAKAFSGLEQPEGYYMGAILAHELAHQMGAQHTQSNDCNRNLSTAFEPGSGSTLMAYAGICAPNVQSLPDDYFHGNSLELIARKAEQGIIFGCVPGSKTDNLPPVADAGPDLYVPIGTPFKLEGTGSDPNGDSLSYLWEQVDAFVPETSPGQYGPIFRSLPPSTSPFREIGSKNDPWEQLPITARKATFRLTVKDHHLGLGSTAFDEMTVYFIDTLGPLTVTHPNAEDVNWEVNSTELVEWNVAGTEQEPISCDSVSIRLSTDGGLTYPMLLASNIPNSGSFAINVPELTGTNNKIKVSCENASIFDVSNISFSIFDPDAPLPLDTMTIDTIVNPPMDTMPDMPTDTVPNPPADTMPDMPTDTIPNPPADTMPDMPTDTIPNPPADTMPDMPTDTIPNPPADTMPDMPTDTIPNPPTDTMPDMPTDTIPNPPTDTMPDMPTDTIPNPPADTMPDMPTDTIPNPPTDTMPDMPTDTIPNPPADTMPDMPTDTIVTNPPLDQNDTENCRLCHPSIDLAPNPTFGSVYLRVKLEKPALSYWSLINGQGQVLEERKNRLDSGGETIVWDLYNYPSGIYWFRIVVEGQVWVKPVVLKR